MTILRKFMKTVCVDVVNKTALSPIVLVFAASVTLWLLESPIKPMLYFFEAALTLTIYHSLHGNFKKARLKVFKRIPLKSFSKGRLGILHD